MHDEKELVAGLQAAEEWAVEELVEAYGDKLLRTALCIVKDYHLAEEIVQETYLKVCRAIKSFDGRSSLYTWLYRIVVNCSRNSLRRRKFNLVGLGLNLDRNPSSIASPEDEMVLRERNAAVYRALSRLPCKYREVLTLYYLAELTVDEIAEVLNEPTGTVKSKLSRGRRKLREALGLGREAWQIG